MTVDRTTQVDVVVIGAGIIGASIALQLARSGAEVLVVDKGAGAGFGSTSASSAIVRYNFSTLEGVATAWESAQMWFDWRDYLQAPADEPLAALRRCGLVMLDAGGPPPQRLLDDFDTVGIPYQRWDAATLVEQVPGIDPGRYWPPKPVDSETFFDDPDGQLGAVYTPDAGFVDDPRLACENLVRAAVRHGARLRVRAQVVGIVQQDDHTWQLTLDDDSTIRTPVVVNAAGPWSGALNALAGVTGDFTIGQRALRQEVHQVPAPAGYHPAGGIGLCLGDRDLGVYIRPEVGGGLLVGGTEPECDPLEWVDDPDTANPNRTAEGFVRQVMRAARRLPGLTVPPQPTGIAGIYDVADDWTPIYDKTERTGFFVAVGTSGNQFKNGPIVGEFMAELITATERGVDHDVTPVTYTGRLTGLRIDLGRYSRRRTPNANSGSVVG